MGLPEITLAASGQTIKAADWNTNLSNIRNAFQGLDDTNYGAKGMDADAKIKNNTITKTLLVTDIINNFVPVGMETPFGLGAAPDVSGTDPYWWPCDGTTIPTTSTGPFAGLTAPNRNDPSNPNYGPYAKGAMASNETATGSMTHGHTASSTKTTDKVAVKSGVGGTVPWEDHTHPITVNNSTINLLGLDRRFFIKIR